MAKAEVATLSLLLVALSACGEAFSPPRGLSYAAASFACPTPGFGPAGTAIELAGAPILQGEVPAYPYVRVNLAEPTASLAPGSWLSPSDKAAAWYVTGPNAFETGSGRVT